MDLPTHTILDGLREHGAVAGLDISFAGLMAKLSGAVDSKELFLAAALTSRSTRDGNVCLDLGRAEETIFPEGRPPGVPRFPSAGKWAAGLRRTSVVGEPGDFTPLVLDEHARLYLHRYRTYQDTLARWILDRAPQVARVPDLKNLQEALLRLFPSTGGRDDEPDWQKTAACAAILRRFIVISGGPGTGKTTTVARILALLQETSGREGPPLRIALAAPTGKAAARLGEAVRRTAAALVDSGVAAPSMPAEASTIHRLLGTIPGSPYFRHNAERTLPIDVLVVDEASMVDLALMSKLVQAVPHNARLILVGDRDQLASVEAGAVLGDICGRDQYPGFSSGFRPLLEKGTGQLIPEPEAPDDGSPIQDSIVVLRKSYRFDPGSGLGGISRLVNQGDAEAAVSLLRDGSFEDIRWSPLPDRSELGPALRQYAGEFLSKITQEIDPARALQALERFRILCALREGPYGARHVNRIVERSLASEGLIHPSGPMYAGRPILVVRNNYELQLFNGDVGIILPQDQEGELCACFPGPAGGIRSVHPMRLPEHETAFAMTVHKSQGSEFDRVLLILGDRPSPVLTRELVYTAVTRARDFVEIWTPETVLRAAVSRRIQRSSGLEEALWQRP